MIINYQLGAVRARIKSMKKEEKTVKNEVWDVVIIGGGPAGMMAAGRAGELGLKIILLEKNDRLGKKLLLTGGGRCNLTNAEFDTRKFLEHLKDDGKFLFSAFSQFNSEDTINFFKNLGIETKIEMGKRAFPTSDSAVSIQNALISYMQKNGVKVTTEAKVLGFVTDKKQIKSIRIADGKKEKIIEAKHFILATGGTSHPETGSTGDGYKWMEEIGHTVVSPEPSLVPIVIKESWVKEIQGTVLENIKLTAFQNNEKKLTKKGRLLFTHFGISGPTIINMSKDIGNLLKNGPVEISLDIFPSLDYGMIEEKLKKLFEENKNKQFKNCIANLVTSGFASTLVFLSGIDPNKEINNITREERIKFGQLMKNIRMEVDCLLGPEESIVASGGVTPKEIDFKTMKSRLYPNLSFAGDIIDINRPSGGYSLQICWTTGYVAGSWIKK